MKKLLSLLLALAMLLSVCAFAEAPAEDTEEVLDAIEEITDDVDIEAEEAALAQEAEQNAPEELNIAEAAFVNDRKLDATISISTAENFLPDLNGVVVKTSVQNNGLNHFDYEVSKDGETLYGGAFSYEDNKLYVQMNVLGEETYEIDMTDLNTLVDSAFDFITAGDVGFSVSDFLSFANIPDLSVTSLTNLDLSKLDLSPMLFAISSLYRCVTIEDIADIKLEDEDAAFTEEEETEETAADTEVNVEEGEEAIVEADSDTVAMIVSAVFTRDDLAILTNAIAATIVANEEILAPFGISAEEYTAVANSLLDNLTEDMALVIGLTADGRVLHVSLDYSTPENAVRVMSDVDYEADGTTISSAVMLTTDQSEDYVTVFSSRLALGEKSIVLDLLQGDPADSATGFTVMAYAPLGERWDYAFEFSTVSIDGGFVTNPFTVKANTVVESNGVDFKSDGALIIAQDNATVELLRADVLVSTAPAAEIDLSNAIDLSAMDAGEDTDLIGAIAEVILSDIEE